MSERAAKVAFALALGALVAAVAAIRLGAAGDPEAGEGGAQERRAPAGGAERALAEGPPGRALGRARRAELDPSAAEDLDDRGPEIAPARRRRARQLGERFLAAYARYEVGELRAARGELRATTSAAFFAQLDAGPPRLPQTVERVRLARLVSLEVLAGPAAGSLQIAGLRARGRLPEPYSFALAEEAGRLVVAGPAP